MQNQPIPYNPGNEEGWAKIMTAVRRSRDWTEEEVYDLAHEPNHLTTEQVFGYLRGTLDLVARGEVERHAATCNYCLAELAELGSWLAEEPRAVAFPVRDLKAVAAKSAPPNKWAAVTRQGRSIVGPEQLIPPQNVEMENLGRRLSSPKLLSLRNSATIDRPWDTRPEPVDVEWTAEELECRFVEDGQRYLLLVRTRKPPACSLLRYELSGKEGTPAVTGFLMFHPEGDGWAVARCGFAGDELHRLLQGECTGIEVRVVAEEQLTPADRPALEASVRRSEIEETERGKAETACLRKALERLSS
jgi:hypothetical protein